MGSNQCFETSLRKFTLNLFMTLGLRQLGVAGLLLIASRSQGVGADEQILAPYFFVQSKGRAVDPLPLKSTEVGVVRTYRNDGSRPIEAPYVFPASTRAAVHGLTLPTDERTLEVHVRSRT